MKPRFANTITTACLFLLAVAGVHAAGPPLPSRTWVSNAGSDLNPCTIVRPCATFAGAYAKTAVGGEIDALNEGDYGGMDPSTTPIQHSITIDGMGVATVSTPSNGVGFLALNLQSTDQVVIRNVTIRGVGTANGVTASTSTGQLTVENVSISNCGIGILFNGGFLSAHDIKIVGGVGVDLYSYYAEITAVLKNISASSTGTSLYMSSTSSHNVSADVYGSTFSNGSGGVSVSALPGAATLSLKESSIQKTPFGVITAGGAVVNLTNTVVQSSSTSLDCLGGGQIVTFGGNQIIGSTSCGTAGFTSTGTLY